jgi:hypothetical protein
MGGGGFFFSTPSCFNCCRVWSFPRSTLVVFFFFVCLKMRLDVMCYESFRVVCSGSIGE